MILPLWKPKGKTPKFPDEAWVKVQIKDQLKQLKIWYYMPMGTTGIPDFICCAKSHFIGIEAKRVDGVWAEAQQQIGREIDKVDGVYIVVDETGLHDLWHLLVKWHYDNILPPGVHDFRRL